MGRKLHFAIATLFGDANRGGVFRGGGVPVLQTDRLVLRAHRADDIDPCASMWGDPLVTRHILGKPSTLRETWLRMAIILEMPHLARKRASCPSPSGSMG